jgi:hypothetical protein
MLNFNVFSGHLIGPAELILVGENTPLAVFSLDLEVNNRSAGVVTVVCQQPLAMAAAKYLRQEEYVVIEGFIRRDKIPVGDGTYVYDLHLVALEILKCEVLSLPAASPKKSYTS